MTIQDIEAKIEEEKRTTCAASHSAAWAEGLWAGIEPEIIAEAAMQTALSELARNGGEDNLVLLLEHMRDRVLKGDFYTDRTCH